MKLLLVVAVILTVGAVAWGKAGEEFDRCRGIFGIPVPFTICEKECAIVGNLPGMTCEPGLVCCTFGYQQPGLEGVAIDAPVDTPIDASIDLPVYAPVDDSNDALIDLPIYEPVDGSIEDPIDNED